MSDAAPAVQATPAPSFVESLKLEPLNTAQYLFLVKIGSPFVGRGPRNLDGTPMPADEMDVFRAVFVLIRPLEDCTNFWMQGNEMYDAAVLNFAKQVPINDLPKLGDVILEHIKKSFPAATFPTPPAK